MLQVYGQTDDFPEKLKTGCPDEPSCRALVREAQSRVDRCAPNTIGRIRCSDARADLRMAQSLLRDHERARISAENERRRRELEQRSREDAERRAIEREQVERAKAEAAEAEEKRRAEQKAAWRAEQDARAAKRREDELRYFRLVGPVAREKELRACLAERLSCPDLLLTLLEVVDAGERQKLLSLNERLLQQSFNSAPTPPRGSILCCDGTVSDSCVCGGRLQGCCSSHGGVCGCK